MVQIGELIKEKRLEQNLTQSELAEMVHLSQGTLAQYETGRRVPKVETVKRFAAALDIPWTDLYPDDQRASVIEADIRNSLKNGAKFQKMNFDEAVKCGLVNLTFKDDNSRAVYYMTKLNECGQDVAVQTALAIFDQRLNHDRVLKFRFLLKLFGEKSTKEIADKIECLAQVSAYQCSADAEQDTPADATDASDKIPEK